MTRPRSPPTQVGDVLWILDHRSEVVHGIPIGSEGVEIGCFEGSQRSCSEKSGRTRLKLVASMEERARLPGGRPLIRSDPRLEVPRSDMDPSGGHRS
jgi:hypothetical protein